MTNKINIEDPYLRLKFYLDLTTAISNHLTEKAKNFVIEVVKLNKTYDYMSREMKKELRLLTNKNQKSNTVVNSLYKECLNAGYLGKEDYPKIYDLIVNGEINKIEYKWE